MGSVTADQLAALIGDPPSGDCLVLSRRSKQEFAGLPASIEWRTDVGGAGDLPADRRYELALLFDQLDHLDEPVGYLLAALRDRVARRVIVLDKALTPDDFMALGFEKLAGLDAEGYLFDPDSDSRRREWNNAANWANPENFDKFRW